MAALSGITAVRPTSNTLYDLVNYGATISAGQPLYHDATDGKYKIADADTSEATANVKAIAITPGVDGGQGIVAFGGSIILVGTTMAVGVTYYAGATPGEIVLESDLSSGDYSSRLGTASTTTQLDIGIIATGIERP